MFVSVQSCYQIDVGESASRHRSPRPPQNKTRTGEPNYVLWNIDCSIGYLLSPLPGMVSVHTRELPDPNYRDSSGDYDKIGFTTTQAFVPPNPKELHSAAPLPETPCCSPCSARHRKLTSSGCRRLVPGGHCRCRIASTVKMVSTAPAAPRRCPVAPFVDDTTRSPPACSLRVPSTCTLLTSSLAHLPCWWVPYWR